MTKKQIRTALFILLIIVIILVGVISLIKNRVPKGLVGEWDCAETAEGSDNYFGYYHLIIRGNGTFSLYDAEAGNPGISGKMRGERNATSGTIEVICQEEDFDPPMEWTMQRQDVISFEIIDDNTIKLGKNGVRLTFYKDE